MLPQDECRALKKEICEALTCLDTERRYPLTPAASVETLSLHRSKISFPSSYCSKYHEVIQKHKARLSQAKQKLDEETRWRDDKIKNLERELSLCSHSIAKVNVQRLSRRDHVSPCTPS